MLLHFSLCLSSSKLSPEQVLGIHGGFCDGGFCECSAQHCQPIHTREPCKSIDLPELLLSPSYPESEGPKSCLDGFPRLVCVAAGAQGHNTSSPCLGRTVLMGEKMASPFLPSGAPIPGVFSVRYYCFGGRHGKIHAGALQPFSCTCCLLSGVCPALPWGHWQC